MKKRSALDGVVVGAAIGGDTFTIIGRRGEHGAPPSKAVVKKDSQAILRGFGAEHAGAERQDIRVVVLAREPRRRHVMAERAADMAVAVGGDAHADAGAADQHAALRAAAAERVGDGIREIRIIDRIGAVGAEIEHLEAKRLQLRQQRGFKLITAVIRGDGNDVGHALAKLGTQAQLYQMSRPPASRLLSLAVRAIN